MSCIAARIWCHGQKAVTDVRDGWASRVWVAHGASGAVPTALRAHDSAPMPTALRGHGTRRLASALVPAYCHPPEAELVAGADRHAVLEHDLHHLLAVDPAPRLVL